MKEDTEINREKLVIFDTTLRDGEQSPGASMTGDEKLRVAKVLEKLRVDVIEAGFAIASQGDFDAVKLVADNIVDCRVCSLARAMEGDIRRAGEAVSGANAGRIHTFIATSPIHMKYKLQMEADEVLVRAVDAVTLARSLVDDVEFSLEDASRTEFDFMCRITEAAIQAGASTINIPDTVGYGEPGEFADKLGRLIEAVPNSDKAIFSVHCHNDLGLAVANSLAAVKAGARQVECTINGLGERAGNASLEEIVMAVRTRSDRYAVETTLDTQHIVAASRLVSSITGFPVQPNKAVVGVNAFAHESGIHQDGVLKHRETYEIMRAQDVGWTDNKLVLGKHSGRAAVRSRYDELGVEFPTKESFQIVFEAFKNLADKKHQIFDEDLQMLVSDVTSDISVQRFRIGDIEVTTKSGTSPKATLTVFDGDDAKEVTAQGDGAVDAALKAIEQVVETNAVVALYSVNAITQGTEAQGEVTVRLEREGRIVNGVGTDTDIVIASAKAYIDAANLLASQQPEHPQLGGV